MLATSAPNASGVPHPVHVPARQHPTSCQQPQSRKALPERLDHPEVGAAAGPDARQVFSVDLRMGSPILHPELQDVAGVRPDALSLTAQAVDAGVTSLVLLDLARIGTGCGADLGVIEALRKRFPTLRLLAGGGVLARRDVDRMRDAGCNGALVASAIHNGSITAADLADLARRPVGLQSPSVSR